MEIDQSITILFYFDNFALLSFEQVHWNFAVGFEGFSDLNKASRTETHYLWDDALITTTQCLNDLGPSTTFHGIRGPHSVRKSNTREYLGHHIWVVRLCASRFHT